MRLLFDGVEVPWPKEIVIEVDPSGETIGPLQITVTGGQLKVTGTALEAALTVTGLNGGELVLVACQNDGQFLLGGLYDESADTPVFVPAGGK